MITKYSIYLESSMGIGNEFKVGDIVKANNVVGIIDTVGLNYISITTSSDDGWTLGYNDFRDATAEEIEEYNTEVSANKYNI